MDDEEPLKPKKKKTKQKWDKRVLREYTHEREREREK